MATTNIELDAGTELPAAVATQYLVPDVSTVRIIGYTICNTSTATATYTIHIVPKGDSATDANKIAHQEGVHAGEDIRVFAAIGQVLTEGATLQAFASTAGALTQRVSGFLT